MKQPARSNSAGCAGGCFEDIRRQIIRLENLLPFIADEGQRREALKRLERLYFRAQDMEVKGV